MDARDYIEAIAAELSRMRRSGLLLSAADAQLALSWHAAGVPLAAVLEAVRRGDRLRARRTARGAGEPSITLASLAAAVEGRASTARGKVARQVSGRTSLRDELRAAAAVPGLRARPLWSELADDSERLLGTSAEAYWTRAIAALRASLPELSHEERHRLGVELRLRLPIRPPGISNLRFRRTMQLQLLNLASALFALPPPPFLL